MEENGLAIFFANLGTQKATRILYKDLEKPGILSKALQSA